MCLFFEHTRISGFFYTAILYTIKEITPLDDVIRLSYQREEKNKIKFKALTALLIAAGAVGVFSSPSYAQGVKNLQNIPDELEAQDIKYRGFILRPKIRFLTIYDSNVFSQPDDEKDDFVFRLTPSIDIEKQYDGHIFEFGGEATAERFATYDSENTENYEGYFRGALRANSRWEFPFSVDYFNKARSRNRPDSAVATTERTSLERLNSELGFKRTFNRLSLTVLGRYGQQRFEDGVSRATGAPVVYSDRDNHFIGASARLEYDLIGQVGKKADSSVFAQYAMNKQTFESNNGPRLNGVTISSDNVSQNFLLGYKTSIKDRLFLEAAAGVIHRNFEAPGIDDALDYDVQVEASYIFRPKLSFILSANRERDDNNDLLVGVLRSTYDLSAYYEVYHNLYWENSLIYEDFQFDEDNIEDVQDFTVRTGLNLIHNPKWRSGVTLDYTTRASDDANKEYDRLQAMIQITKSF